MNLPPQTKGVDRSGRLRGLFVGYKQFREGYSVEGVEGTRPFVLIKDFGDGTYEVEPPEITEWRMNRVGQRLEHADYLAPPPFWLNPQGCRQGP